MSLLEEKEGPAVKEREKMQTRKARSQQCKSPRSHLRLEKEHLPALEGFTQREERVRSLRPEKPQEPCLSSGRASKEVVRKDCRLGRASTQFNSKIYSSPTKYGLETA